MSFCWFCRATAQIKPYNERKGPSIVVSDRCWMCLFYGLTAQSTWHYSAGQLKLFLGRLRPRPPPPLTVMILSFRTDRPGQTVQTQIRLLLEEEHYSSVKPSCTNFRVITANSLGVRIFRIFTVIGQPEQCTHFRQ